MPDVIFINIELADIDVRRISSILKKNKETAETSLVAITPETDDKTVKKLTKLGFDEVVKSNPGEEELLELFGRLLGKN